MHAMEMSRMAMYNNCAETEEVDNHIEENWNLPTDFDLFSTHEVRNIYYPQKEEHEHEHEHDEDRSFFKIECIEPSSPLDIINRSQSLQQYDATGHCVWTGAFLLISCIQQVFDVIHHHQFHNDDHQEENGITMIELGCGTGIGGLSITLASIDDNGTSTSTTKERRKRITQCTFTDYDPAVLNVCHRNCELNGFIENDSFITRELTWGCNDDNPKETFDLILATDVLYDIDLLPPLFNTASTLLSSSSNTSEEKSGLFILSHVPRACYNDNNPPQAIENLEQYIIDQARDHHGFKLKQIIRPSHKQDTYTCLVGKEGEEGEDISSLSFIGSAILIFYK